MINIFFFGMKNKKCQIIKNVIITFFLIRFYVCFILVLYSFLLGRHGGTVHRPCEKWNSVWQDSQPCFNKFWYCKLIHNYTNVKVTSQHFFDIEFVHLYFVKAFFIMADLSYVCIELTITSSAPKTSSLKHCTFYK